MDNDIAAVLGIALLSVFVVALLLALGFDFHRRSQRGEFPRASYEERFGSPVVPPDETWADTGYWRDRYTQAIQERAERLEDELQKGFKLTDGERAWLAEYYRQVERSK